MPRSTHDGCASPRSAHSFTLVLNTPRGAAIGCALGIATAMCGGVNQGSGSTTGATQNGGNTNGGASGVSNDGSGASSGGASNDGSGGASNGGNGGASNGGGGASSDGSGGASNGGASSASASSAGSGAGSSGGTVLGSVECDDTSATAGMLTTQYNGAMIAAGGSKSYYIQPNWWHTFSSETEAYNGLSFTVANPQDAADTASDGNPMGFPSIFIGQYGGHTTTGSNLPKQVSALTSVPTIYITNSSAIGLSDHNATYDVWFTESSSALSAQQVSPGAGGAYLMVWMFMPTDRQPRGADTGRLKQTVMGVPGTWNVWIDKSTDPPCISYVSATPIDGLEFDLNDFIQDSVTNQYGVTSSMYLSLVFGGFEIWGHNDGLQLQQFCAQVN